MRGLKYLHFYEIIVFVLEHFQSTAVFWNREIFPENFTLNKE